MANLGLRIGEVVQIKLENIDLTRRKFDLVTEKSHKGDSLYLHDEVFEMIRAWVELHYTHINAHSGYLLYSELKCNIEEHISPHLLRSEFRQTVILAGLNETYGKSDERLGRTDRRRYRLTTHSLRHYFITKVYRGTKDPIVAQKLARHTDLKSTQVYIHTAKNDLDGSMDKVFEKNLKDDMKDKEDMKKLVRLWQMIW